MQTDYLKRFRESMKTADREITEFISHAEPDIRRARDIQRFIQMMAAPETIANGGNGKSVDEGGLAPDVLRLALDKVDQQDDAARPLAKVAKG